MSNKNILHSGELSAILAALPSVQVIVECDNGHRGVVGVTLEEVVDSVLRANLVLKCRTLAEDAAA